MEPEIMLEMVQNRNNGGRPLEPRSRTVCMPSYILGGTLMK